VLLALGFAAGPALADPAPDACAGAYDPGTGAYDATSGVVKWHAPEVNTDGEPLSAQELASCTFTFWWDGGTPSTVIEHAVAPGACYSFVVPQTSKLGKIEAFCTNSAGIDGPKVGPLDIRFRLGVPAAPELAR
jgi:hypothetical protein